LRAKSFADNDQIILFSQLGEMMQERICPLLLASKRKEDSKNHGLCIKENCAWWFFKGGTVTGAEIAGKCCLLQIAEALR
jgi:hypothetical protein